MLSVSYQVTSKANSEVVFGGLACILTDFTLPAVARCPILELPKLKLEWNFTEFRNINGLKKRIPQAIFVSLLGFKESFVLDQLLKFRERGIFEIFWTCGWGFKVEGCISPKFLSALSSETGGSKMLS